MSDNRGEFPAIVNSPTMIITQTSDVPTFSMLYTQDSQETLSTLVSPGARRGRKFYIFRKCYSLVFCGCTSEDFRKCACLVFYV